MSAFLGILIGIIVLLLLCWVPILGPLIAGFIAGLIAESALRGLVVGFLVGLFGSVFIGILVFLFSGTISLLHFRLVDILMGGFLGTLVSAMLFIYFVPLTMLGGLIGGVLGR